MLNYQLNIPKIATLIQGFDGRLHNRPISVFDFRAFRRSVLGESQKLKISPYGPDGRLLFNANFEVT